MSTVVVDTSVALKWALAEDDSPRAVALLNNWIANGFVMLAPPLAAYEVANALRQKVRRSELSTDDAKMALARILAGGLQSDTLDEQGHVAHSQRALELAEQLGLAAAYDAHFLALAEREGCEYWTADERLWNGVKGTLPWVRWLGEFIPAP